MFERFTERARRVIFYARYEASQYGNPYIETDHLLLGLLREDFATVDHLIPGAIDAQRIRARVEEETPARERISTSVEVPLTQHSKRVLKLAAVEAETAGHRHIGTEHILLGLLLVEEGLAYKILSENKPDIVRIRNRIRKLPSLSPGAIGSFISGRSFNTPAERFGGPHRFLECLQRGSWRDLSELFAEECLLVNTEGEVWAGHKEISENLQLLLAPFATKKAKHRLETEVSNHPTLWMGLFLWEHIHLKANADPSFVRMTIVFTAENGAWRISALHLTAADEPRAKGKSASN